MHTPCSSNWCRYPYAPLFCSVADQLLVFICTLLVCTHNGLDNKRCTEDDRQQEATNDVRDVVHLDTQQQNSTRQSGGGDVNRL